MTYRPEPDTESDDRPALEIEITPEMTEAGAAAVRHYDSRVEDEESLAESVFIAMLTAVRV